MLGGAKFQGITPLATETSAIPGRGPGDSHETTLTHVLAAPPSHEKASLPEPAWPDPDSQEAQNPSGPN